MKFLKKIFFNFSKYFRPKKFLALINFFFKISTPKCKKIHSEFVRPKKNLGFGFGCASRPKTQYTSFFGSYKPRICLIPDFSLSYPTMSDLPNKQEAPDLKHFCVLQIYLVLVFHSMDGSSFF